MKKITTIALAASMCAVVSINTHADGHKYATVPDSVIADQRANLEKNTKNKGYGPQSPRDIDAAAGNNTIVYNNAPEYTKMNLCNIHFHKNAEHAGGQFRSFAGNGNGKGYHTGFKYSGKLTSKEMAKYEGVKGLNSGDTIELHYVHSSADVKPGPTLGACLSDANKNPQLRVETQVYVLVNDRSAADFVELTTTGEANGFQQALSIPNNTGKPVVYAGSTTGPSYNEKGSPFQVTWSVRPDVMKVDIETVGKWFEGNVFDETKAHGVRNLVTNVNLLSKIQ